MTNNYNILANKSNVCLIVTISPGNYTVPELAAELKTQIQTSFGGEVMNVAWDQKTNTISIQPANLTLLMKILTDADLATGMAGVTVTVSNGVWAGHWNGIAYDHKNPMDMNDILGNSIGVSTFFSSLHPYVTQYVDLQPIKNIYMYSSNLGTFKTIGCKGEVTIIKKVPVTADTHQMIFSSVTSESDWLDCSRQTLKTLWFELKDSNDNHINFHGAHVSFSLSFDKYREVD